MSEREAPAIRHLVVDDLRKAGLSEEAIEELLTFAEERGTTMRRDRLIGEAIDAWHDSESELPLHEYLGWSAEEYTRWFLTRVPPERGVGWDTP